MIKKKGESINRDQPGMIKNRGGEYKQGDE